MDILGYDTCGQIWMLTFIDIYANISGIDLS